MEKNLKKILLGLLAIGSFSAMSSELTGLRCSSYYIMTGTLPEGTPYTRFVSNFHNLVGDRLSDAQDGVSLQNGNFYTFQDISSSNRFISQRRGDQKHTVGFSIDVQKEVSVLNITYTTVDSEGNDMIYSVLNDHKFETRKGTAVVGDFELHYSPFFQESERYKNVFRYSYVGVDCTPEYK